MRDRILTPFFPLQRGSETPGVEPSVPVSARDLEGQLVDNGRLLLMHKTTHTERSARFVAKDLMGSIDVEVEIHPDETSGIRVGRRDATNEWPTLPDLCAPPVATKPARHRTFTLQWRRLIRFFHPQR